MRIAGDELVEGGNDARAMQEIAIRLEATGKLDYLNVIASNNLDRVYRAAHWPPTPAPHGLFVPLAAGIKKAVKLPVFTIGRIVDPDHAERILADGQADMIGMTRAHIADPEIVAEDHGGHPEDIRPCVGANVCIARVQAGGPVRCLHNPETGREHAWGPAKPAKKAKRIAVIGGGSRRARSRARGGRARPSGHASTRRTSCSAGSSCCAPRSPSGRNSTEHPWRRRELEKMQVRIELGREIQPGDMAKLGADTIMLATGAEPPIEALPGAERQPIEVATPHEVVRDGRPTRASP